MKLFQEDTLLAGCSSWTLSGIWRGFPLDFIYRNRISTPFFLFRRSALLFSILILGFLSKKYKPLVNQKIVNKEGLIIKLATNRENLRESFLYCKLLQECLSELANELWMENKESYTQPLFDILGVSEGAPLGLAFLGLHDE